MPGLRNFSSVRGFRQTAGAIIIVMLCAFAVQAETVNVAAGGDLQSVLNSASPGDTIVLAAGATYTGAFVLPATPASRAITITSSRAGELREGVRVTPADAPKLARLAGGQHNAPIISTARAARGYRFIGIEFALADNVGWTTALVYLEAPGGNTSLADQPREISFDRCLAAIPDDKQARRAIAMNGAQIEVRNSHFAGFKENGTDSQALLGWNGSGFYKIINNYLEAASENVMFGGGDAATPELIPSDIEIRGNHFSKPPAWRTNGNNWNVKNLFELKAARRVVIEGNLFENNWIAAQSGNAIVLTPRNQDGRATFSEIRDITFKNNIVRNSAGGVGLLCTDYIHPSQPARNITFENNLFYNLGGQNPVGGGQGYGVFISSKGCENVVLNRNTLITTNPALQAEGGATVRNLTITNNLLTGHVGQGGSAGLEGLDTLAANSYRFAGNLFVGLPGYWRSDGRYGTTNRFADSLEGLFTDADYTLTSADAGADVTAIREAMSAPVLPIQPPTQPPTQGVEVTILALPRTTAERARIVREQAGRGFVLATVYAGQMYFYHQR